MRTGSIKNIFAAAMIGALIAPTTPVAFAGQTLPPPTDEIKVGQCYSSFNQYKEVMGHHGMRSYYKADRVIGKPAHLAARFLLADENGLGYYVTSNISQQEMSNNILAPNQLCIDAKVKDVTVLHSSPETGIDPLALYKGKPPIAAPENKIAIECKKISAHDCESHDSLMKSEADAGLYPVLSATIVEARTNYLNSDYGDLDRAKGDRITFSHTVPDQTVHLAGQEVWNPGIGFITKPNGRSTSNYAVVNATLTDFAKERPLAELAPSPAG